MTWPKGKKRGIKTGGRVVGSKNKITMDLREMICGALEDAGGRAYVAEQAKAKPAAFLTLLGRIIPQQVKTDLFGGEKPVQIQVVTGFDSGPHER